VQPEFASDDILKATIAVDGDVHPPRKKENAMSNQKVWFITGASRGMGVDFAKAALAAGHAVVASGRDRDRVSTALGQSNDLLSRQAGRHEPC